MKIIISESQEKILMSYFINEDINFVKDKILMMKKYLDDNFMRANMTQINDNGYPDIKQIAVMVDSNKQPLKYFTDVELFYLMQDQFKNIITDKKERDNIIKELIKQWYIKEKSLDLGMLKNK